jgi:3-oxoacyl-[acyl-carrier-protein] synthase II
VFNPRTALEVAHALTALLHEQHLALGDLDLVLLGNGGDNAQDQKLRTVEASLPGISREYFKNYCGEYHTAAAFAVWLGVQRLSPPVAAPGTRLPKTCLIINQYRDVNYSIILLTRD